MLLSGLCTVARRTCGAWGGVCCVCPWAVGSMWAPCWAGDYGSPPPPRHLLAICLRKPSPSSAAARACGRGGPGSQLGRCCHCGLCLLPAVSTAPAPGPISSGPIPCKGPVRGFPGGGGRRCGSLLLSQSNVGASREAGAWNGGGSPRSRPGLLSTLSTPGLALSAHHHDRI